MPGLQRLVSIRSAVLAFVLWPALTPSLRAADPDAADLASAMNRVHEALQAEIAGDLLLRERMLVEAQAYNSQLAAPYWFQGRVADSAGQWLKVLDAIDQATSHALMGEYEAIRASQPANAEGNWQLAIWCAERALRDQARAHLLNVVLREPDHVPARLALGHLPVGNEWLTVEQQLRLQQRARRAQAGREQYGERVARWVGMLDQGNPRKQADARAELKNLTDPIAITPMVQAAGHLGPQAALFLMEWLGGIDHPDAALALSQFAVSAGNPSVREAAIQELKSKSLFDFVPELLNAMSSPITFMTVPVIAADGQLTGFRQAFAKEGMNENRTWNFDTKIFHAHNVLNLPVLDSARSGIQYRHQRVAYDPTKPFGQRTKYRTTTEELDTEISGGTVNLAEEANQYFAACAKAAAVVTAKRMEVQAQIENAAISELNQRVAYVMSNIAEVEFNEVPRDIWAWWDNYNETDYQSSKFDRRRYNDAKFVARMDYYYEPQVRESRRLLSESVSYGSCFVAGTRVWTLRGLKPIESLAAGDLVLSRGVDSGELCFKPVVAATTRQPAKTVVLEVGEDKLHATTSHLLWVSGKGWTKCGEIVPGDLLHSTSEPAVVISQQAGPVLPTHNVIVADNHTYFVGSSQVLSHDVVPRGAAHELVPGQFAYAGEPAK